MKANRLSQVQQELKQKGNVTLEDLGIPEDIQAGEEKAMHYLGINTYQEAGSYGFTLKARVIKITQAAHIRKKGLSVDLFDDVILLHDGTKPAPKKPRAKAAPKADTDK